MIQLFLKRTLLKKLDVFLGLAEFASLARFLLTNIYFGKIIKKS